MNSIFISEMPSEYLKKNNLVKIMQLVTIVRTRLCHTVVINISQDSSIDLQLMWLQNLIELAAHQVTIVVLH